MTESQRAAVAVKLANMKEGGNHYANLRSGQISQSEAAVTMKVSQRLVSSAQLIKTKAPLLFRKIVCGEMTVNEAVKKVKDEEKGE